MISLVWGKCLAIFPAPITFCLSIISSLVIISFFDFQSRGFGLMINGEERGRTGECAVLLLSLICICVCICLCMAISDCLVP